MPFFVSNRELKRLEREASDARKRASEAEARLYRVNLAVLDLAAKKLGAHAISTQVDPPKPEKPQTEAEFREGLKEHHLWSFYLQSAVDAGKSEEDAMDALVAMVRGEPLPYQVEGAM